MAFRLAGSNHVGNNLCKETKNVKDDVEKIENELLNSTGVIGWAKIEYPIPKSQVQNHKSRINQKIISKKKDDCKIEKRTMQLTDRYNDKMQYKDVNTARNG